MGILSWIMDGLIEPNCASAHAKSTTREMVAAALTLRRQFKHQSPSNILCGRWALNARPDWQRLSETSFRYEKTGEVLDFADSITLTELIEGVVGTEVRLKLLQTNHNQYDTHDLVLLARQEVRETIHKCYGTEGLNGADSSHASRSPDESDAPTNGVPARHRSDFGGAAAGMAGDPLTSTLHRSPRS
jgi:hypothetical protein